MKTFMRTAVLSTAALVLLTACPRPEPTESDLASKRQFIPLGEYGSLTGPTSSFGTSVHRGIQMAIDEVNESGGVKGQQIRLFTEDTQSKPEQAANAVTKLISEHDVVAILGEVASSSTLAAAPIAQSRGIPMISPASTNPKVTEVGDFIFRIAYVDTFQAQALARFVREELGLRKGAILKDVQSDYSMGLAQYFSEAFQALGGEIVIDQNYKEGDIDFSAQLAAVKKTDPDFLFIPGYYTEAAQVARQTRQLGMSLPLIGADGWESPELLTVGGAALEGAHFSSPFFALDPRPAVSDFVERFTELHDVAPDALAALGYDAARVLADAMERAESLTPQAIRDAIGSTTGFSGVTGEITIGPTGDTVKPIVILKVQNGETTLAARVSADGEVISPPRPDSDDAEHGSGQKTPLDQS